MNENTIKVLLVDDHAVVREGYRTLLGNAGDIEVVAEAASGEDAYSEFVHHAPDVVIMDLSLPGIGGLGAIRRIKARQPSARILVFSMYEDTVVVEKALQAGASGYITKNSAPAVMIDAVREIAGGAVYFEQEISRRLDSRRSGDAATPLERLSAREFEIFCMLAQGAVAGEIAERLSLSQKTVANYSTLIKNKLDAKSAADLAGIAMRHGLLDV